MQQLLDHLHRCTPLEATLWLTAANVTMFAASLVVGEFLARRYVERPVTPPPDPLSAAEVWLAIFCIILNSGVAVAGWAMWKGGWIDVRTDVGLRTLLDVLVLLVAMDFLMYVFHRVAHARWLYPIAHRTHHRYDRPRPLNLFVLNPFEVLGFGALWLMLLCVYDASLWGILIYLVLNLAFGTIGHLGVEPFPRAWQRFPLRHLGSSTFHANHHQDRKVNFGFYTDVWDRMFGTLSVQDTNRD
jgi:sterol desaturase/sphingolipid hydroxylase (fatty acid hydroxylase superfamily)